MNFILNKSEIKIIRKRWVIYRNDVTNYLFHDSKTKIFNSKITSNAKFLEF